MFLIAYYDDDENYGTEWCFDLTKSLNGSLAGLVGVTAGAGIVEPWAAAVIGIISGWIYLSTSSLLVRLRLDDAVDGIPIHMFCGIWGLIAVGLLASPGKMLAALGTDEYVGFLYTIGQGSVNAVLLLNQFIAILFIIGWSVGIMMPFFFLLSYLGWLRADTLEEIAGLDASYKHGTQEDHEQLKKSIRDEYKKHKKRQQEIRERVSRHAATKETGSASVSTFSRDSVPSCASGA